MNFLATASSGVAPTAGDSEEVISAMWAAGAELFKSILGVDIGSGSESVFANVSYSDQVLDISRVAPGSVPRVEFSPQRQKLRERLLSMAINHARFRDAVCVNGGRHLTLATSAAEAIVRLDPKAILKRMDETFVVNELSLLSTVTEHDYVFTKINHRCWEEVASIGLSQSGNEYIRDIGPIDWDCVSSGFYEVLALCLAERCRVLGREAKVTTDLPLCGERFSFGISLTGGNSSYRKDLRGKGRDAKVIDNIYSAVTVGTASGLLGFFSSLARGDRRWLVADGAAPKALFWNEEFGEFLEKIVSSSDAILLVVPPWLSDVTIPAYGSERVFKLIVPGQNIDTLWGLVVPVALQHIGVLSSKYRLTVLSQCSVVSAIIGMLAARHISQTSHRAPFRFYDLGQLLDLGNIEKPDFGYWLSRKDVRKHAHETNNWSHLLSHS